MLRRGGIGIERGGVAVLLRQPHLGAMPLSIHDVSRALAAPPLGVRSDHDLNPSSATPVRPGAPARDAAVLCGLVPRRDGLSVILTRRAEHLRNHAGQISFPGGKREADDPSLAHAALREAHEEIGLSPSAVGLLGPLDPYVTVTGFRVTPYVGEVDPDFRPVLDRQEVELVFEAPLDFLMDPSNCARHHYDRNGVRRHYYAMPWNGHYIWGATAGMLKGLADRLATVRGLAG